MRLFAADTGPWWNRLLRWTGRAASLASLALLALFATSGGEAPTAFEWLLLACFPIGVSAGMLLAWRSEIAGGLLAAASLAAFHVALLVAGDRPPSGPWFLVFTSPALLLGVVGVLSRLLDHPGSAGGSPPR